MNVYSDLRMIALMPVNVCDNTLQCSFCLDVRRVIRCLCTPASTRESMHRER